MSNMKYELALKLKNAGFPQVFEPPFNFFYPDKEDNGGINHCSGQEVDGGCYGLGISRGKIRDWSFENKYNGEDVTVLIKVPTLEELIEACGEDFKNLYVFKETWYACWSNITTTRAGSGETPTEAVAMLWLSLNQK